MNLMRCENGHFYDADKFQSCPHCAAAGDERNVTMAFSDTFGSRVEEPVTVPPSANSGIVMQDGDISQQKEGAALSLHEAVEKAKTASQRPAPEEGKTISLYRAKTGVEPVAGWLVCIAGNAFGESFKLKTGRNFIGRGADMDVVLASDVSVSRDKHAIILYEPRKREFIAQPGESRELFYLNEEVVLGAERLKQYDVITVGGTKLMFFPCCGENFSWDDYKKEE